MNCSLFDIGCHFQSGVWNWWESLGLGIQALYVVGALAVIFGISWSLLTFIRAIGGWPAFWGGAALIVATFLAFFVPRKPKQPERHENVDSDGPVIVRRPSTQNSPPGKRTRTIFDQLGKR